MNALSYQDCGRISSLLPSNLPLHDCKLLVSDDFLFENLPSDKKRNHIKKSIHSPETTSKNIFHASSIEMMSLPLRSMNVIDKGWERDINSNLKYAKRLKRLDIQMERLDIDFRRFFLNTLQRNSALQINEMIFNLHSSSVEDDSILSLSKALRLFPSLEIFDLDIMYQYGITDKSLKNFAFAIGKLKNLKKFSFVNCTFQFITEDSLKCLHLNLEKLIQLESLKLHLGIERIKITGDYMKMFCNTISGLIKLQNLELVSYTETGFDFKLAKMGLALSNLKELKHLNMSLKYIDPVESKFDELTEALNILHNLVSFCYQDELMNVQKLSVMLEFFKSIQNLPKLENLNLLIDTKNPEFLEALSDMLKNLPNLKIFRFTISISIENETSSKYFFGSIGNLSSLQTLDLKIDSEIPTSKDSNTALSKSLSQLKKLKTLKLEYSYISPLSDEYAIEILEALSRLDELRSIDFEIYGTKKLTSKFIEKFQELSLSFSKLAELNLYLFEAEFDDKAMQSLSLAFGNLKSLHTFFINFSSYMKITSQGYITLIEGLYNLESLKILGLYLPFDKNIVKTLCTFLKKKKLKKFIYNFASILPYLEDNTAIRKVIAEEYKEYL